ncbi:MAG: nucleotidyltransferase domain-containing protein [Rhodospirillales bacterium]|nr:nucleotidyltransferase domain-containing protein [Rhodospirillales bacterium]
MGKLDLELVRTFKKRVQVALPGRVAGVVLFGSRARGEAVDESDWDVAVFLTGEPGAVERRVLSDVAYDLVVETGQYIQHIPLPERQKSGDMLLLRNIRRDGVAV